VSHFAVEVDALPSSKGHRSIVLGDDLHAVVSCVDGPVGARVDLRIW
jgi:hypothetical protein